MLIVSFIFDNFCFSALELNKELINAPDKYGYSPLMIAGKFPSSTYKKTSKNFPLAFDYSKGGSFL